MTSSHVRCTTTLPMCCSVLQCAVVCCSVLQHVAVICALKCCAVYTDTCSPHTCAAPRPYLCVAVCCSALQCVEVCCSCLCVAVCCSLLQYTHTHDLLTRALRCNLTCVVQCVAVCCSVVQLTVFCCMPLRAAVRCSMLQSSAICCSVLQYTHTHDFVTRTLRHELTSILPCAAICCNSLCAAARCIGRSVLQSAALCCNNLQPTHTHDQSTHALCHVLQCATECGSTMRLLARCSVLQSVAVYRHTHNLLTRALGCDFTPLSSCGNVFVVDYCVLVVGVCFFEFHDSFQLLK